MAYAKENNIKVLSLKDEPKKRIEELLQDDDLSKVQKIIFPLSIHEEGHDFAYKVLETLKKNSAITIIEFLFDEQSFPHKSHFIRIREMKSLYRVEFNFNQSDMTSFFLSNEGILYLISSPEKNYQIVFNNARFTADDRFITNDIPHFVNIINQGKGMKSLVFNNANFYFDERANSVIDAINSRNDLTLEFKNIDLFYSANVDFLKKFKITKNMMIDCVYDFDDYDYGRPYTDTPLKYGEDITDFINNLEGVPGKINWSINESKSETQCFEICQLLTKTKNLGVLKVTNISPNGIETTASFLQNPQQSAQIKLVGPFKYTGYDESKKYHIRQDNLKYEKSLIRLFTEINNKFKNSTHEITLNLQNLFLHFADPFDEWESFLETLTSRLILNFTDLDPEGDMITFLNISIKNFYVKVDFPNIEFLHQKRYMTLLKCNDEFWEIKKEMLLLKNVTNDESSKIISKYQSLLQRYNKNYLTLLKMYTAIDIEIPPLFLNLGKELKYDYGCYLEKYITLDNEYSNNEVEELIFPQEFFIFWQLMREIYNYKNVSAKLVQAIFRVATGITCFDNQQSIYKLILLLIYDSKSHIENQKLIFECFKYLKYEISKKDNEDKNCKIIILSDVLDADFEAIKKSFKSKQNIDERVANYSACHERNPDHPGFLTSLNQTQLEQKSHTEKISKLWLHFREKIGLKEDFDLVALENITQLQPKELLFNVYFMRIIEAKFGTRNVVFFDELLISQGIFELGDSLFETLDQWVTNFIDSQSKKNSDQDVGNFLQNRQIALQPSALSNDNNASSVNNNNSSQTEMSDEKESGLCFIQ